MNTLFNQDDKLFITRKEKTEINNEILNIDNETKIDLKQQYIKNKYSKLLRNNNMDFVIIDKRFIHKYKYNPEYVETDSD
jgi:hypothetical protein